METLCVLVTWSLKFSRFGFVKRSLFAIKLSLSECASSGGTSDADTRAEISLSTTFSLSLSSSSSSSGSTKSPISVTQLTAIHRANATTVPLGTTMAESESLASRHIVSCELTSPSTKVKSGNFLVKDEIGSTSEKQEVSSRDIITFTSCEV